MHALVSLRFFGDLPETSLLYEMKGIQSSCGGSYKRVYLRNEFDVWKVHGIMNTSGLLQNLARDPTYS